MESYVQGAVSSSLPVAYRDFFDICPLAVRASTIGPTCLACRQENNSSNFLPSIFNFIFHNPLPTYNVIHHEQQEDSHHVIPCTVFRCHVTFCFAVTRPAVLWVVVTVQASANALLFSVPMFCYNTASTAVTSRDSPGLCPCSVVTRPALSWSVVTVQACAHVLL